MLSEARLAEIEARDKARTQGKWWIESTGTGPHDRRSVRGRVVSYSQDDIEVCAVHPWNEADGEFIAACSVDVPELLRMAKAFKALVAEIEERRAAAYEEYREACKDGDGNSFGAGMYSGEADSMMSLLEMVADGGEIWK